MIGVISRGRVNCNNLLWGDDFVEALRGSGRIGEGFRGAIADDSARKNPTAGGQIVAIKNAIVHAGLSWEAEGDVIAEATRAESDARSGNEHKVVGIAKAGRR